MLVGISVVYVEYGTMNLSQLKGDLIPDFVAFLLLLGMIAKSAQIPFHIWLPEAGVAPTPVTALLHAAVLVKIGVYTFGRIFDFTFTILPEFRYFKLVLSIITILVSGFMAYVETDIKKILAYSTISQLGYIFMGFATNVKFGVSGAILYIVSHAIAKAGLFLAAGIVEHNTHQRDINTLGGLSHTMKFTSVATFLCMLSIIGIPISGGFWAKMFVISSIIENKNYILATLSVIGAVITLLYMFRFYNKVFLGEKKYDIGEGTPVMVVVVLILAVLSVLLGVFPNIVMNLIRL